MKNIIEFLSGNATLLWPLGIFLVGWILPVPKFMLLGEKAGEHIPADVKKLLNDRIDAFQEGLLNENFRGDKTIVSNEQVFEAVQKVKLDLGLKE